MTTKRLPGTARVLVRGMCCTLLLLAIAAHAIADAPMQNYCALPPLSTTGVAPNLLFMIDNSSSMYDPAYVDTDPKKSASQKYCVDSSYDNSKTYLGYFTPSTVYTYNGTYFAPGAFPSSCTVKTDYLCLNLNGPAANRFLKDFAATGSFLNWLSMSQLDLQKWVLTGGKVAGGYLQGETRGCQGKRFVKLVPALPNLTFAVRGPIAATGDYTRQPGPPGPTIIELYDKPYTSCATAIEDWNKLLADPANTDTSALKKDALACRGSYDDPKGGASDHWIYTQIMTDCYAYLAGKPMTVDVPLENSCKTRVENVSGSPLNFPAGGLDSICGGNLPHSPRYHLNAQVADSVGFLGVGTCVTNGSYGTCDASLRIEEMLDYCQDNLSRPVSDLSQGAGSKAGAPDVPNYILDGGIALLGKVANYSSNATGNPRVAIQVRISYASPPTGVVQQFAGEINMGAMVFNDNGAGSECQAGSLSCKRCISGTVDTGVACSLSSQCPSGYSCQTITPTDGGVVKAHINYDVYAPAGDTSALVTAINGVDARSWTPLAETFYEAIGYFSGRTDLRLQSADFDGRFAASKYPCRSNNILIISDGMPSADSRKEVNDLAALYALPGAAVGYDSDNKCPSYAGSRSLDDLAWLAAHRNIKSFSIARPSTDPPVTKDQSITTHVLFTGAANPALPGECNPETLMKKTAASGGGLFASAPDAAALRDNLKSMLQQIAATSVSGDSSLLATGSSNGAIFLKEQYFPRQSLDGGTSYTSWAGELTSLWYYIDPLLSGSTGDGSAIREDTVADRALNLKQDRIVNYRYDPGGSDSFAYLTPDADGNGDPDCPDADADGKPDCAAGPVDPGAVAALWRAGISLWQRNPNDRTVYTQTDAGRTMLGGLDPGAAKTLKLLQAADSAQGKNILSYVLGSDIAGYRSRTVVKDGVSGVWKLGDILSSGARAQTAAPLNRYHLPPPAGYRDTSYRFYTNSASYQGRDMVYVGANDGMLHAFKLGTLDTAGSAPVKARLCATGTDAEKSACLASLGKEEWAFVPKNVLPYLKYLADPQYQHLYYVDGGITLVDASIGNPASTPEKYWNLPKPRGGEGDPATTWRTILIAGMGLGGASAASCDAADGSKKADCVATPAADPDGSDDPAKRVGYSSYFALDVTDPHNPSFLWEFSDPALGYATSGPAIVRIGDRSSNGRWFAVFGSGPTGSIEPKSHQFLGGSNQPLRYFVIDLRSGKKIAVIDSGIDHAFSGSLSGGASDLDRSPSGTFDYEDDVIYSGFVAADGTTADGLPKWKGGVGRLVVRSCRQNPDGPSCDKAQDTEGDEAVKGIWHWSKVIDSGPVTAGIAKLQDRSNHKLWLYFGTGRYFYRTAVDAIDDRDAAGSALYGVKEPCYGTTDVLNKLCTSTASSGDITDQTFNVSTEVAAGWKIALDPPLKDATGQRTSGGERVVSDPTALGSGAVLFPTFQPSLLPCRLGDTYLWGVQFDTGGAISAPVRGKGVLQLSTGAILDVRLSDGFTGHNGRRTEKGMEGKPGRLKVISNANLKPLKKIIHIQER